MVARKVKMIRHGRTVTRRIPSLRLTAVKLYRDNFGMKSSLFHRFMGGIASYMIAGCAVICYYGVQAIAWPFNLVKGQL